MNKVNWKAVWREFRWKLNYKFDRFRKGKRGIPILSGVISILKEMDKR